MNPAHPGGFVKSEIIEALDLSVTDAAEVLGVTRAALSALLNERSHLSPEMALRIEKAFGVSMDTLMRMQNSYDIAQTRKRAGGDQGYAFCGAKSVAQLTSGRFVTLLSSLGANMDTEADTCRKEVIPKLVEAGWDRAPYAINEQRTFTDGRIVFVGGKARRGRQKRADFILRYRSDFPIAVVEAKSKYKQAADGLQQVREYAEILGLKFAYSTNGHQIVEIDYTTGIEREVSCYPSPEELWTSVFGHRAPDRRH